jgi:hypothetical protein
MIRKTLYIALAGLFLIAGCTKDFEELDRPKTTSDQMDPNSLFTRSLVTGSGLSVAAWQWMHQISGSVYAQHFANIQTGPNFTSDNYEPRAWNVVWDWYYARSSFAPLHYNFHVINLSRELENPIKEAVARIWNVYMVQQVTDMYGDMPLSEAFISIRPAFDAQKDVYLQMFSELEVSINMIKQYQEFGYEGYGQADVLFQGDLNKWIRFANTMKLRLGLRASNTTEFGEEILPYLQNIDVNETMNSHQHTAQIIPDPDGPTYHVKNPLAFVYGWHEVRLSKTMFDILDGLTDPRLEVFAEPNANGEYVGLPNGQPHSELSELYTTFYRPNYCNIGQFFIQDNTPHFLVTYAEASFMKAEAAQKGFINGSAEEFYNEGIRASFEQFGIDSTELINEYLSGPAQFDPANALEQIWTQRWIALYPNGHEAWSVVRRTGYPEMMQPVYTFPGNDEMPRRKPFPDTERQYNADNYQQAVSRMGGDSQYTRVWWDGGN